MYFNTKLLGMPSFYAHIFNGLLLLVAILCLFKNYYSISHLDKYRLLVIILLFAIAIGVHGLSHLGLEMAYGYQNKKVI